ncbi:MAG: hypothetical protein EA343_18700 [Nodularia sp. (in: Bacteria)]|nr:MAG: hypothetical protein EA343_18700 [Nodularia sp. (in: cyanobacteria)]
MGLTGVEELSVWRKWIVIAPVSLSIALLVSSCEDQVTQCQRLIQVVNAGNSLIDQNKGEQVITSLQLSRDLQAITQSLEKLNLTDPNLKEFKRNFASIFKNMSEAIAQASLALGAAKSAEASPAGRETLEQARNEIDTSLTSAQSAGKQSDILAEDLNKYCRRSQ